MGCSASVPSALPNQGLHLSPAQKSLIRETWETVETHRFSIGKGTFLRFFEANPEYQELFPEFRDVKPEELYKTSALYGHSKRVIKAVETAVTSLDDAEAFTSYLEELGRRHKDRNLKPIYLDSMQEAFTGALKELLQKQWTTATAEAWHQLFHFISCTMVKGLKSD